VDGRDSPPEGPTDTYKGKEGESRRVTIVIAELRVSSDLGFQKTVDRKQRKYAPLIKELEEEGWTVRPIVHVVTVGVRATVPIRNVKVLKSLRIIKKPAQQKVRASMAHILAASHLNRIVPQYRRLAAQDKLNVLNLRPGCGTVTGGVIYKPHGHGGSIPPAAQRGVFSPSTTHPRVVFSSLRDCQHNGGGNS
jgi:hypothetical protein